MNAPHELGSKGEKAAAEYLQRRGYHIRHLNWRHHRIELDIVAEIPDYLVIVEVKTRSTHQFSEPYEAVNYQKMRHLVNATQAYIFQYNIRKDIRFDIISIVPNADGDFQIEHIRDAFVPPVQ